MPITEIQNQMDEITIVEGKTLILAIEFFFALLFVVLITFGYISSFNFSSISYEIGNYVISPLRLLLGKLFEM